MPACAMISCASGYASTRRARLSANRRQPAAAVDQDRHAALRRDREHRSEALVVEHEFLCPRMELDAASAEVEAALGLRDRLFGQIEADVGDQPAVRARAERERPVVAGAEAGMPVRLVEAEDIGEARDPVAVEDRLELLVPSAHPVDVVAEMRVCVEDVGAGGQLRAELGLKGGEELLCSFERLAHSLNLPAKGGSTQRSD